MSCLAFKLLRPQSIPVAFACTLALAGSLVTRPAPACGGLFCSNTNPVNQAAERIIFAQDGDRVSAVIEIQYEGPADAFAWVLPVPAGDVEVGVSSKQLLDTLQQQSNPQYNLQSRSDCMSDQFVPLAGSAARSSDAARDDSEESAVEVVVSGSVGPYDYVQLALNDALDDPADVAVEWLEDNGFDVSNIGRDLLGPYLEGGMDLLAFRLNKDSDTGSIRPVFIEYDAKNPMIPIQPTAVAANDDMGVMVWVLGDARAVAVNYLELELNEAKIHWFNPSPTYNDVVIEAADEAGGQGFVTEQATDASTFEDSLVAGDLESAVEELRSGQFSSLEQFFNLAIGVATTFNPSTFEAELYDGFADIVGDPAMVPLRDGATALQLLACVGCYFETDVAVRNDVYPDTPYDPETDPIHEMDPLAFVDAMEELVVDPLLRTQGLFGEHRKVTRFYTTLSADEMTVDPMFDFNADLDDVDNVHVAEQVFDCDDNWYLELPQGIVLEGSARDWPVALDDDVPFNFKLRQLSTSGRGEVVEDNTEKVDESLSVLGVGYVGPYRGSGGCGCRVGSGERSWGIAWVVLLMLFGARRRRASQSAGC